MGWSSRGRGLDTTAQAVCTMPDEWGQCLGWLALLRHTGNSSLHHDCPQETA